MTAPVLLAIAAFIASVGLGVFLWRSGRARASFALLISAPIVGAAAFAGSAAIPSGGAQTAPAASPTSTVSPPAASAAAPAAPTGTATAAGASAEVDGWRHAAEELRRARRFADARDMLAKVVQAAPMDADAWADLGDASAAAAGDDLGAGREAIDRALRLDPRHPKALWLKASLELQQHHYSAAEQLWQQLLAELPADSNDTQIVKANLAEARALAAKSGAR